MLVLEITNFWDFKIFLDGWMNVKMNVNMNVWKEKTHNKGRNWTTKKTMNEWMLIVKGKDPLLKAKIDQIKTTNNLERK